MITLKELFPIGFVSKTHGIKGELNVALDTDYNPENFRFLVFDLDSTLIPFELTSSRGNGLDNRLIALRGVDSIEDAKQFVGKTVYCLVAELKNLPGYNEDGLDEESLYLSDLIGYTLLDEAGNNIGRIVGFNDDTQNYLLEVERQSGKTFFVPYVEDWLLEFNPTKKTISFNLPQGLYD